MISKQSRQQNVDDILHKWIRSESRHTMGYPTHSTLSYMQPSCADGDDFISQTEVQSVQAAIDKLSREHRIALQVHSKNLSVGNAVYRPSIAQQAHTFDAAVECFAQELKKMGITL